MGPFPWRRLPTPVRPAFTTITLLLHTPLIIIGAADVAFNRHLLFLSGLHVPRYELRAFDFVSLSLPALHNLIVHHHPISCTLTFSPSHFVSHHWFTTTIVHVQHDAINYHMGSAPGTNSRHAGE
jgi:hypothetical protein